MNRPLSELQTWAISAREIEFDDELKARLGPSAPIGEENAKHVQAYIFSYKSLGNTISGFMVTPRQPSNKPLPVIIYNRGGTKDFGVIKLGMLFKDIAV